MTVVLRRPVLWGGAAIALLIALAIPAFSLHTINSGAQGLPQDMAIVKVYNRIQKQFPGGAGPAVAVISARDVTTAQITARIAAPKRSALATGQLFEPITTTISASRQAASVEISIGGKGTDAVSNRALETVRNRVIPATIGRVPGVTVNGPGWTAQSMDFNNSMNAHAPCVFLFVLGLAFVLLLMTFRSIVIPIKAILLEPALGRRRLRRTGADLPEGPPTVAARIQIDRRRRRLAAAVPVRRPVRRLDGLPRADLQPRTRGL